MMRGKRIKFIYDFRSLDTEGVIHRLQALLVAHGIPITGYSLSGTELSLGQVIAELEKKGRRIFTMRGHGLQIMTGNPSGPDCAVDFLSIETNGDYAIDWEECARQFASGPSFVMAWLVDREYEYWQNAEDPREHTSEGRSIEHLPMVSNNHRPPNQAMIIDVSGNPGRWRYRQGYTEAVGSTMWLGERFWPVTGADKDAVEHAAWLQVSHPMPSVTRIQAADTCFTTAEGESGELQDRLRALLFPHYRDPWGYQPPAPKGGRGELRIQ
ncbi:MAG: hypothetical protein JST22_12910 [Bacteroidetes bacterium]|nr:hypothetical protein [Bacteroidota bacterium]